MTNYQKKFLTGVGIYLVTGALGITNRLLNRH